MSETMTAERALIQRVLRSAWVTLTVCTGASMAGAVYFAQARLSGSIAAMTGMGSVAVVLWLSMHLRGGLSAVHRASLVHPAAYRTAATGVVVLVGIALTASFSTLHSLMLAEGVPPVQAALIPASLDVGVVVSTIVIFALDAAARRRDAVQVETPVTHHEAPHEAPVKQAVKRPVEHHEASHGAPVKRPVEQSVTRPATPRGAPASTHEARRGAPAVSPVDHGDALVTAQRILDATPISQPADVIADVLTRAASGESQRKIAAATAVSPSTVGRIITASRELDSTGETTPADHQLVAV